MDSMEEMIVTAGSGVSIPPHPEGQFAVTCIDLIDRGMVKKVYDGEEKMVHKCTLRFWAGEYAKKDDDGAPLLRDGQPIPLWLDVWANMTIGEKSTLRAFLKAWRGVDFTKEEAKRFNLVTLLGKHAFVQVTHNTKNPERTYANVDTVMKLPKGVEPPAPLVGYVRVKDRDADDAERKSPFDGTEDDLPF